MTSSDFAARPAAGSRTGQLASDDFASALARSKDDGGRAGRGSCNGTDQLEVSRFNIGSLPYRSLTSPVPPVRGSRLTARAISSKKNATGTSSTCLDRTAGWRRRDWRRARILHFAGTSSPIASPSFSWLMPRSVRRSRTRDRHGHRWDSVCPTFGGDAAQRRPLLFMKTTSTQIRAKYS